MVAYVYISYLLKLFSAILKVYDTFPMVFAALCYIF